MNIASEGGDIQIRWMRPADEAALLVFARTLPTHDLLFLRRDISQPKVLAAWAQELEGQAAGSLVAERLGAVVGCAAIIRDPLSWSPHVAELRVIAAPDLRGKGLGLALAQESFAVALAGGAEKVIAMMTVDQAGGMALFEGLGFRPEALLREQVKDRDGKKHDLVVLSLDVAQSQAQMAQYGLTDVPGAG
jgi:N-acetylglutamate synthase-like GNAT family acetyltransferase